jgi:hypothetical protein
MGKSKMDNPEKVATLGTRQKTTKTKQKNKKIKIVASVSLLSMFDCCQCLFTVYV